jgi:hypothetical protein
MATAPRLRDHPMLLIEAFLVLSFASAIIAILPFRLVARIASGSAIWAHQTASQPEAKRIASAVAAWGARVPWRAVCFQQGLAAFLMLRRRHCAATLFYGAALNADADLVAHVWVRSNTMDVIGCENASDYRLLTTFPIQNG